MSGLRPLNGPRQISVQVDAAGKPIQVTINRKRRRVIAIHEEWRIDDEWWRHPISRGYVSVVLEEGRLLTMYRDLVEGGWYMQNE